MSMTFGTSDQNTVTSTSQEIPTAMTPGVQYLLRSSVDAYFAIGLTTATTASAANNSHYIAAGMPAYVSAISTLAKYVAIIRVGSTDGVCTLSRLEAGSIS
jgi:hypothetical protein